MQEETRNQASKWSQNPIFAAAGEEACRKLASQYPSTIHPPGTEVAREGTPSHRVYVLLEGTVRTFHRTPDGREAIARLLHAPMILGDAELLHGLPLLEGIEAVDEIELATVPGQRYLDLLQQHPAVMLEHLRNLAGARCVASRHERQVFASLEQRVANLLLAYADCFGHQGDQQEVVIDCPLTQSMIARSLGTVRRSVVNVVSQWGKREIVGRREGRLVLLRPAELELLAAPIRGSLYHEMGMPMGHLARPDQLDQGEVKLINGPGSLSGRRFEIGEDLLIGRAEETTLRLPDQHVCPRHCRLYRGSTGSRFWIEDLDSVNGTWVNNRRIRRAVLRNGDQIRVGGMLLQFRLRPTPVEMPALSGCRNQGEVGGPGSRLPLAEAWPVRAPCTGENKITATGLTASRA